MAKKKADKDDMMLIAPISHNTAISDPTFLVPVDPSYGRDKNSYVICDWGHELLHRNAVIRAEKPGVNCDVFVRNVLEKINLWRKSR